CYVIKNQKHQEYHSTNFHRSLSPPPMYVSIRKENQIIHIYRKHKEKQFRVSELTSVALRRRISNC
ncbi:MAG: hypothetical protein QN716_10120, partial [Nitrososphaeraceae archaeon]|nr:hypothetical protein [Nitrososphaeraceae archaeon]